MIGSIGSGYAGIAANRMAPSRPVGTTFASVLAQANSNNAEGDQVLISPVAQSASNKASTSAATIRNPQLAAEADAISAAQGLRSGEYNFSSMTGKQLNTVVDSMVQNGKGSDESINGLRVMALFAQMSMDNGAPDKVHNVRDELTNAASFAKSGGDALNYKRWTQSLDFINTMNVDKSR